MASIGAIIKVLKAVGREVDCGVHRAPVTNLIEWMMQRGFIVKPGELFDASRLQAAREELMEECLSGKK